MRHTCVIFDIDGTLLDSTALDERLYGVAIRTVLGNVVLRSRWSDYEHVSDAGILQQICAENDLQPASCVGRVRACFGALVSEHIALTGVQPMPGARRLFEEMRADGQLAVGIATGGWGHTARLKLQAAGLETEGVPLKSSDDHHERVHIMAMSRRELASAGPTLYVGDGAWDQRAAEQLGWSFLGIGQALRGRCVPWLADFSAHDLAAFRAHCAKALDREPPSG